MKIQIANLGRLGLLLFLIPLSASAFDDKPSTYVKCDNEIQFCFLRYPIIRLQHIVESGTLIETSSTIGTAFALNALASAYIALRETSNSQFTRRLRQLLILSILIEYLHFISPCIKESLIEATVYRLNQLIKNPLP